MRTSAFGRGYLDLELLLALFAVAAGVALWVDRPDRDKRSIAELLATSGAALAAAAVLLVPGTAGHAAQTAPRTLALVLDWLHLARRLALDRRPHRPARPLAQPARHATTGRACA